MQGLSSIPSTNIWDKKLFLFSLLVSSLFIYYTQGVIRKDILEEISTMIQISTTGEIENKNNKQDIPCILWILRDFNLKVRENDSNAYLEKLVNDYNPKMMKYFKECYILPYLRKIDNEVNKELTKLKKFIFDSLIKQKSINGSFLNGLQLAELVLLISKQLDKTNTVSYVDLAMVFHITAKEGLKSAKIKFAEKLKYLVPPIEWKVLNQSVSNLKEECLNELKSKMKQDDDFQKEYIQEFILFTEDKKNSLNIENSGLLEKIHEGVIKFLTELMLEKFENVRYQNIEDEFKMAFNQIELSFRLIGIESPEKDKILRDFSESYEILKNERLNKALRKNKHPLSQYSDSFDIYLSYCRKGMKEEIKLFSDKLEKVGFKVWHDDTYLPYQMGQDYIMKTIIKAINTSKLFLLIWNRNYNESIMCKKSLNWAVQQRKNIIVIELDKIDDNATLFNLTNNFSLKLYQTKENNKLSKIPEERFRHLVESVKRILNMTQENYLNEERINSYVKSDSFDIYLSYCRKGMKEEIKLFSDKLENEGFKVWYDDIYLPNQMGQDYMKTIIKAINTSKFFFLIWNKGYSKSENCKKEFNWTVKQKKDIVVIELDKIDDNEIIFNLAKHISLQLFQIKRNCKLSEIPEESFRYIVDSIKEVLKLTQENNLLEERINSSEQIKDVNVNKKFELMVVLKISNEKVFNVKVDGLSDTLSNLKIKVKEETGIEMNKQCLIFNGIRMKDEKSLSDYSIINGSVILLKLITDEEHACIQKLKNGLDIEEEILLTDRIGSKFFDLLYSTKLSVKNISFSLKHSSKDFNYPFGTYKLSPVFELKPNSLLEQKLPIRIRFKGNKIFDENSCLFKQNDDENDRTLNKWTIHFQKNKDLKLQFDLQLKTCASIFLGLFNIQNDRNKNELIKPGLNYVLNCEDLDCSGNKINTIVRKNLGKNRPYEDIANGFECSFCKKRIDKIQSLKAILLCRASGSIIYKLNSNHKRIEETFNLSNDDLIILSNTFTETFTFFIINLQEVDSKSAVIEDIQYDDSLLVHSFHQSLMSEYLIRGECSIEGKEFISNSIDLIIQPNSVKEPTIFWVKEYTGDINYPFEKTENDLKLNAFEIGCDSKHTFEVPVTGTSKCSKNDWNPVILRYKNIDVKLSNLCLFKHQFNEENKQNVWTLHFPTKRENETIEFELKSFSIVFLSVSKFCMPIKCLRNNELNLEEYLKIKPGLNFRINCNKQECQGLLRITQMGYGKFEYNEVPLDDTRQFSDICSRCLKRFNIENICSMIFFKSKFNIRFHTTGSSNLEIKTFENNLFFIWNTRLTETYSYLAIQVDPREIEILNANIYARLDIAEFQKLDVPQMTYADYPIKGSYYS